MKFSIATALLVSFLGHQATFVVGSTAVGKASKYHILQPPEMALGHPLRCTQVMVVATACMILIGGTPTLHGPEYSILHAMVSDMKTEQKTSFSTQRFAHLLTIDPPAPSL